MVTYIKTIFISVLYKVANIAFQKVFYFDIQVTWKRFFTLYFTNTSHEIKDIIVDMRDLNRPRRVLIRIEK